MSAAVSLVPFELTEYSDDIAEMRREQDALEIAERAWQEKIAEALALLEAATRLTESQIQRLGRIEHGLVRLLDRADEVRAAIHRGQALQVEALKLCARVRGARP